MRPHDHLFKGSSSVRGGDNDIASPGSYKQNFAHLASKYPRLDHYDPESPKDSQLPEGYRKADRRGKGKLSILDFSTGLKPRRLDLLNVEALKRYFEHDSKVAFSQQEILTSRRLFLLEGLDPDFVSVLGEHLGVDPLAFAQHYRTDWWSKGSSNACLQPLPSRLRHRNCWSWQWYELRSFNGEIDYDFREAESLRHVAASRMNGSCENVGRVARTASYWSIRRPREGWDALIIVDPPIAGMLRKAYDGRYIAAKIESGSLEDKPFQSEPFQGGYMDFLCPVSVEDACSIPAPQRDSLRVDLCHYWVHCAKDVEIGSDPMVSTVFLQKIIAAHYMQLTTYLNTRLWHMEWILTRHTSLSHFDLELVEENWCETQAITRRCFMAISKLEVIMTTIGATETSAEKETSWSSSHLDFVVLCKQLVQLESKADAAMNAYSTLASIVASHLSMKDSKRSITEAKAVKCLGWLGTCYLPLSLAGALFSMNEKYLPGEPWFWVYFTVAIPLVLATVMMVYCLSMDTKSTYAAVSNFTSWLNLRTRHSKSLNAEA